MTEQEILQQIEELENSGRKQYLIDDFVYDACNELYWCIEDLVPYSDKSVNAMIPKSEWETEIVPGRNNSQRQIYIKPSSSIARIESGNVVEACTWWPGMPRIINDVMVSDSGDAPAAGRRVLNTYKAAIAEQGDAHLAMPWVEHLRALWPDDFELLLDYFAHTVQRPYEKINFGMVLLGEQGIGKDSALLPLKAAIGEWNCREITPDNIFDSHNPWVECVLLLINEARPTAEDHKATSFYEQLKLLTAAPPNWLTMNQKYLKQKHVRNLLRVIITSNDPYALYVPEEDRRLYMAQSHKQQKWCDEAYFDRLYKFFAAGGYLHVAAFLLERDISKFDPNKRPEPNQAWHSAVGSWSRPADDPLWDLMNELGWPNVFFGNELLNCQSASFDNKDEARLLLRSSRKLAAKMGNLGYRMIQSPNRQSGWQWYENKKRFKARVAFYKVGFDGNLEAEIEKRGRQIAANGVAEKSNVVAFDKKS